MKTNTVDKVLETFLGAYLECAAWSSTDENGEPLDGHGYDFTQTATSEARRDCKAFLQSNYPALVKASTMAARRAYERDSEREAPDNVDALAQASLDFSRHGHDFWLTRNGHGAGFWDRGYGQLGDDLTQAAKVYGSADVYISRKRLNFA